MSQIRNTLNIKRIILKKPRITEKATILASAESPVYTFEVPKEANKIQVANAVIERFKVTPTKIRIVNLPAKKVNNRRSRVSGMKSGVKKAMIYLKKGETIDTL